MFWGVKVAKLIGTALSIWQGIDTYSLSDGVVTLLLLFCPFNLTKPLVLNTATTTKTIVPLLSTKDTAP